MSYVAASAIKTRRPLVSRVEHAAVELAVVNGDSDEAGVFEAGHDIDLRQLRHHTKNTLQRIIALIAESPGLSDTPAGAAIARELEYRICLSATISNALFGLTDVPGSMADRLRQLAGSVVDLMRGPNQTIRVGVSVKGCCPADLRESVMRAAHELIGNAVKHGMKGRSSGRIAVRMVTDKDMTTLTVVDNGWGFAGAPQLGEGLSLALGLAARVGGTLEIDGADGTVATMELPH